MKRWVHNDDTGLQELQKVNPTTGLWETIKDPDPRFEYGLFPFVREVIKNKRRIKWIGFKNGLGAALHHDSGTDFI